MTSSWFVRAGGKVYGPIDSSKLKQLVADHKINHQTEISQNQAGPWTPAGRVRGLFAEKLSSQQCSPLSAAVTTPIDSPIDSAIKDSTPAAAVPAPRPLAEAESFGTWYRRTVGGWNILLQIPAWLFGGYFFIPLCWAFSRHAPLRARRIAWGLLAFMSATWAIAGIGIAVSGKVTERTVTQTRSVDFVRRGNRILLNELEEKTKLSTSERERNATQSERTAFTVMGAIGALFTLFFLFKTVRPGGDSLRTATMNKTKI